MLSIRLLLWRLIAAKFPGFTLRNILFRFLLRNTIGQRSSIHRGLEVFNIGGISIGQETTINKHVDLDGRGGLKIGDRVSISAYTKILTASHDPNSAFFELVLRPVEIEDYVWVGYAAIILPGVKIGRGAIVAAGSVVTRDVAARAIVAGNPARPIGQRSTELQYSPFWRPRFQ